MSLNPESGRNPEPLGVRRQVELSEVNTEAVDGLAPASDTQPETETGPPEMGSAAEDAGDSPSEDATASPEKEEQAALAQGITVPAPQGGVQSDGVPPDRPKKPVLAAVAIGGAVVLAVPILLIGTGSHHGKKHPTTAAADNVLPGDGQPGAGAFTSTSPTPTPTPSPSASAKKKAKGDKKGEEAKKSAASAKKGVWAGVSNVLLKNAASGLCADLPAYGNGSVNGKVTQYYCALGDADNQVWSLGVMRDMKGPGGTALFLIRNTKDNLCMDLPYYSGVYSGTKVTEYNCRPKGDNQLFYRSHTHGNLYRIRNYSSHGLCLGPTARSHAQDKQLEVHQCGSGDEWSWPSGE